MIRQALSKSKSLGGDRYWQTRIKSPIAIVVSLFLLYTLLATSPSASRHAHTVVATMGGGWGMRKEDSKEIIAGLRSQVASLMKLRVDYGEMYCEKHGIGPTGGFCVKSAAESVGGNHEWDKQLCARMAQIFADSTVLDLGCGLGWYGKCLQAADRGIEWTGFDGSEGIEKATDGDVRFADLTMPQFYEKKYDWVMSLEVGEHIPGDFEDIFLSNLVRHAKKGILLSWAIEGNGGHHHVNNHNNDYVIDRLREKGFEYDSSTSQLLRDEAELPWFKKTVMLFHRK